MFADYRPTRFGSDRSGWFGCGKNRLIRKWKVKLHRLLELKQFSHPAVAASDVTERKFIRNGLRVKGFLWLARPRQRLLVLLCFYFSAIFRRKDLGALQIFVGINVLGLLRLVLLSCLLLASGPGYILRVCLSEAKNRAGYDKNP